MKLYSLLEQITLLRKDLKAQTLVREERGHLESSLRINGALANQGYYIVDYPAQYAPDVKKREAAQGELQKIKDSLKWYNPLRIVVNATLHGF